MIKIARNSYRLANSQGVLTEYLIWCKLKNYNSQGTISKSPEGLKKASNYLDKSIPTLRRYFTKLVKIGLIRREKNYYSLVSYDKAWKLLGLEYKGSPTIYKFQDTHQLKENVEFAEILTLTKREAYNARKSILKEKPKMFTDTEMKSLASCSFRELPQLLDKLYEEKLSVMKYTEEYLNDIYRIRYSKARERTAKYIKTTPYLTCLRISTILGYNPNPRTGKLVRDRIQKAGLAKWERREVIFTKVTDWRSAVKIHKLVESFSERLKDTPFGATNNLISKMIVL